MTILPQLSEATRRDLLALARQSLEAAFRKEPPPRLGSDRAEAFGQSRAIFVTLEKAGELRGCIGTLSPDGDLARTVPSFARKAAFEDPRFPPLRVEELTLVHIELSVLTAPQEVGDAEEITVGRDGLILECRGRRGLLLPQVATDWGFDRTEFLDAVSEKAGLPKAAWRDADARLWIFQAEVFGE